MLGRKQEMNLQAQQIADGLLLSVSLWLAHTVRYVGYYKGFFEAPIAEFRDFQWMLFLVFPFGPIFLELQGFYTSPQLKPPGRSLGQILRAGVAVGLLIAVAAFFFKFEVSSRAVMPAFALVGTLALLVRERLTVARMRARARIEQLREPVILAGRPDDIARLRAGFNEDERHDIEIVHEHDIETCPVSELVDKLHAHSVSRVIFAGGRAHLDRLEEAIAACEIEGVEAWLIADFIKTSIARPDFDAFGARPAIVFRTTPAHSWALMLKDVLDRVGAACGLIFGLPVFVFVAVGVKLGSSGPIFFSQQRAGKNGRPFRMYKFRSMRVGAEAERAKLEAQNEMSGPVFKVTNDPRVTPFGRFIRRTSLDEIPQLWNVLRGEMSLVGPRPLPTFEVEKFEANAQRRRLSMKPGLTCLWQIGGRSKITDFAEWVRLDLEYIDNWSLWLDVKILCYTVPVVLFGRGAR